MLCCYLVLLTKWQKSVSQSARNFFSRNDSFQHRGERRTDHFEWLNTACKGEGGKKVGSFTSEECLEGEEKVKSRFRPACCYCLFGQNICDSKKCRTLQLWSLRPKRSARRAVRIFHPTTQTLTDTWTSIGSGTQAFFVFSFASWHELNKWASGQFLSLLPSRRLNFWIFAAPMINRFQYDVGASISQTWVCVQRSGQRYCTADRKQPVVLRERETFGYPQVADGAGCGGNLYGPRKIFDRFVWSLTYKDLEPHKEPSQNIIQHIVGKREEQTKRLFFLQLCQICLLHNSFKQKRLNCCFITFHEVSFRYSWLMALSWRRKKSQEQSMFIKQRRSFGLNDVCKKSAKSVF